MPCRKKCCGKHTTTRSPSSHTGQSCVHSQNNPRAVIVSSSGCCLPSVPAPCDRRHAPCSGSSTPCTRPGTPCSMRSRTSCVQEYCTSDTCRNSRNCCEDPPQNYPYGKREQSEAGGSCSGSCRAQERTTGTQWQSSDLAPRSGNLPGACQTVSANTSPVNLAPGPCAQRHQMPSCSTTPKEDPSKQNISCKPIIRQQSDATEQNRHRVSQHATQCPTSRNPDVELPSSPVNKVGCGQIKCTDEEPLQEHQPIPYAHNTYEEPQDESLCISNTAEDLYSSVNTDCGQSECINKPILKPQANSNTHTSRKVSQSTTECPISCNTTKERRSTANNTQIDQSECTNKAIQCQKDNSKDYSNEPQSVTQCSTSCRGTIKPDKTQNNVGCGQPGCTKSKCGNEDVDREESQLSLNAIPNSQIRVSQPCFNESKLDGSSNVCRDSRAQLEPNNERKRSSSCQAAADLKHESVSQTRGTAVPSARCASTACPGHTTAKCLCRYPPAFSQYGCTGNITGDCDCANSN